MPLEEFRTLPTVHAVLFGADSTNEAQKLKVTPEGRQETYLQANNTNPQSYYISAVGVAGAADNAVVYTSPDISFYNTHAVECTAGVVDIQVSLDGTNYNALQAAVLLHDDVSLGGLRSITIAAGKVGVLSGKYKNIRVLQNGVVASNCRIFHGVS